MLEAGARVRKIIPEETMLSRLAQSEQMREFFIQMWMQNPGLAKQGGIKVQDLMAKLGGDAPPVFPQQPPIMERTKQRGASLIELIMFIVIVSVALAGILLVMNTVTKSSADPLIHKQALAIAESLLEEVELMPFTFCDPNDANAATATAATAAQCPAAGGVGGVEIMGLEAGEVRGSAATPFDNVNDYAGFGMPAGAILDITGVNTGLAGYILRPIAIAPVALQGIAATDANGTPQALRITVTVTGPDNVDVVVDGIRTRYSPRI